HLVLFRQGCVVRGGGLGGEAQQRKCHRHNSAEEGPVAARQAHRFTWFACHGVLSVLLPSIFSHSTVAVAAVAADPARAGASSALAAIQASIPMAANGSTMM